MKFTLFHNPLSFVAPSPRNPSEYLHTAYISRN